MGYQDQEDQLYLFDEVQKIESEVLHLVRKERENKDTTENAKTKNRPDSRR